MLRNGWNNLQSSLKNITGKIGKKKVFFSLFSVLPLTFISGDLARSSPKKPLVQTQQKAIAPARNTQIVDKVILPESDGELSAPFWQHNAGMDGTELAATNIVILGEEFAATIGRFESTIIGIAAKKISDNLSLGESLGSSINSADSIAPRSAIKALSQAKAKYRNFQQLVNSGQHSEARAEWQAAQNILLNNYPRTSAQPTAEVRAIWLDRGTIVKARGERDLARLFDRLAAAGINTVFFETINASYPIYPSRIAPEQNPLTKGWDPLKAAVKLAKARNMELHAWVWTFAAANQRHNEILNKPKDYLGPVLSRHPDWAISDRQGRIFNHKTNKAFFDPANPEVRKYLLSLIQEIATNYQVDGIQLDYIRYPFQSPHANLIFGYSNYARRQFQATYGVDPIEIDAREPRLYKWNQYRIAQVDRFVEDTSRLLKSKYPHLILSAAVFPSTEGHRSYQIQQHWEKWAQKGWVDTLVPMTYATSAAELARKSRPLFDRFVKPGALILPGIRLHQVPDRVVVDQMQMLRHLPTGGYALFAAEYFNSNLANILGKIQGGAARSQPLPHRQPFQASLLRYKSLQKEWIYLASNSQISLDRAAMQKWAGKSRDLETALQQLAVNPSNRSFLAARSALRSYQKQFPFWLRKYQRQNPYLVKSWSNRLEAIEELLNYGDRTILTKNRNRLVRR